MDWLRQTYGPSLCPDGSAVAHIVDDGGYPRAVQRFLHGWRASSSRDVELPVAGPVKRVIHSPDGYWLACEVAPDGGNRDQIWVVTTNPDDREAWRIDHVDDGTADLIGWDGDLVAVAITRGDGIGESCLIDPVTGETTLIDRRTNGYLVDSWAGCALVRVGPRGYRELNMLRGGAEIALLPSDPGSVTDLGFILDDHHDRRIQHGDVTQLYRPARMHGFGSGEGFVRALVRSDNGCEFARLLEVTATPDGTSYHVIAERPDADLDEFTVSDDLSTVALLWNVKGCSELQIISLADEASVSTVALPGLVARELSISAGGAMIAVTVEGPGLPRTVELFDTHARRWQPIERPIDHRATGAVPRLVAFDARDGMRLHGWWYEATQPEGALIFLHGGPEYEARPSYSELYPALLESGISVLTPNVRGSAGFGKTFVHADDRENRFGAISDVADCVRFLVDNGCPADRIACAGWSYGGYLTLAALTFHPELFAAGVSICGMSDLGNFYRHTESWIAEAAYPKYGHPVNDRDLLAELSPLRRIEQLSAPLLVVHGVHDTNVPVRESSEMVAAAETLGKRVKYVLLPDEGHDIVKPANRLGLVDTISEWITDAFSGSERLSPAAPGNQPS